MTADTYGYMHADCDVDDGAGVDVGASDGGGVFIVVAHHVVMFLVWLFMCICVLV